jgi:tetratricopeptide (TPR) repeat protein
MIFAGEVFANIGRNDEAIQWFKKALKVKPDHIPAHLTMAKVNQKMVYKFFLFSNTV